MQGIKMLNISEVTIHFIKPKDGLIGFASVVIDGGIRDVLDTISFPDDTLATILPLLKSTHEQKAAYHNNRLESLRKEYDKLQKQLDRALDLLIDGTINKEQYDKKLFECKDRQKAIDTELADHTDADKAYMLSAEALFKLASRISGIFELIFNRR